jgi:hypothetical protein
MSDPFKLPFNLPPPSPVQQTLTIDAAEFVALRTIVMVILSLSATQEERSGGQQAQKWINSISEVAIGAIRTSSITDDSGRELERLKARAADHVNRILGGIKFPKIEDSH